MENFMRIQKSSLVIFVVLGIFGIGNALAGNTYKVSTEITENGKTIGSPALVVKAGVPATVAITGDKGYRISVQVESKDDGTIDVTAHASTAQGEIASTLNGNLDTPMTVATGEMGLKVTVSQGGG